MIVIRNDIKFGIVMYPYNQEYAWFYFKIQGNLSGLEIVWDEMPRPINIDKTEIIKAIKENVKEMLMLLLIGETVESRNFQVDI